MKITHTATGKDKYTLAVDGTKIGEVEKYTTSERGKRGDKRVTVFEFSPDEEKYGALDVSKSSTMKGLKEVVEKNIGDKNVTIEKPTTPEAEQGPELVEDNGTETTTEAEPQAEVVQPAADTGDADIDLE
jgi:hypothetical protein